MSRKHLLAILPLILVGCATHLSTHELAPGLRGTQIVPDNGSRPRAGVVILHGSGGLRDIYFKEAEFLASHGYASVVLDYYPPDGFWALTGKARKKRWMAWQQRTREAVTFLQEKLNARPVALIGFSQGAALAMSVAGKTPGVEAVVSFFGPGPESWYIGRFLGVEEPADAFERRLENFPPTLLIHGGWDPLVSVEHSRAWQERLLAAGRTAELVVYPRASHALNDPMFETTSQRMVEKQARATALRFLEQHLAK